MTAASKATSDKPETLAGAGIETLILIAPLDVEPIDPCDAAEAGQVSARATRLNVPDIDRRHE